MVASGKSTAWSWKSKMNKILLMKNISVSYQGVVANDRNHFSILRDGGSKRCRRQHSTGTEFLVCSFLANFGKTAGSQSGQDLDQPKAWLLSYLPIFLNIKKSMLRDGARKT